DVNVRPAVVVEVVGNGGDGEAAAGVQNAGFFGNVRERTGAVVAVEDVGVAGEAARGAPDGDAFPFGEGGAVGVGSFGEIELDVVADEEIKMAITVVIEEGAACAPTVRFVVDASLLRDVGEGAVAVVAEKNVVAPESAEEVVPVVVVVITDADTGLPAAATDAGFFGDVGERSVAIVFVKVRGGSLARGPILAEKRAVCGIDVEPAVIVVIEEGNAGTFGFDDVFLVVRIAPDVRGG